MSIAEKDPAPLTEEEKLRLKRAILFTPCSSKKELHKWLKVFLGYDIPDAVVDEDSDSCPMDMIWEVYEKCMLNNDPDFDRVLYWAARDSFKCSRKGTKLLSLSRGLVSIEDIQIGESIWTGWSWQPVENWIHDGIKESVQLELETGHRLTVSPVHRVWAWRAGQAPAWIVAAELTETDLVSIDTSHGYQDLGEWDEEEFEKGYLCGILQGDGCLTRMDLEHKVIISASDQIVADAFQKACLKYAGKQAREQARPRDRTGLCTDYVIHSRDFVEALKALGLSTSYSYQKSIPHAAYTSRAAMAGFVSGLFDTDGSICGKKKNVNFQVTAETMLRELQVLLNALGVNSRFSSNKKRYGIQNHVIHRVTVNGNEVPALLKAGVKLRAKKASIFVGVKTYDAHDGIPMTHLEGIVGACKASASRWLMGHPEHCSRPSTTHKTITREKVPRLTAWAKFRGLITEDQEKKCSDAMRNRWGRVRAVERGSADFYDVTVRQDHSYWSDGIISHNTFGAALLEVLAVLHLNRDVAHMAAIESQSRKSQQYVKSFLNKPVLRDFVVGDSLEITWILRYYNAQTGENLNEAEYKALPEPARNSFKEVKNFIRVVVATMSGANCIDPLTLITMGDGSQKPAFEVEVGDEVRTFDIGAKDFVTTRVGGKGIVRKPRMRIHLTNGTNFTVSQDHLVFTNHGWTAAGVLKLSDKFLDVGEGREPSSSCGEPFGDLGPVQETVTPELTTEQCPYYDQALTDMCRISIERLEFLEPAEMLDLHIDTDNEHRRNFVGNSAILLHNSEHVPFFCVDGETKIVAKDKSPGGTYVESTARDIFHWICGVPVAATGLDASKGKIVVDSPAEIIEVLSTNMTTGALEFKPITAAVRRNKNTVTLDFDDCSSLKCTEDHPVYVAGRGFLQARDISVGMTVLGIDENKQPTPSPEELVIDRWEQMVIGSLLGNTEYKKSSTLGRVDYVYLEETSHLDERYLAWKWELIRDKLRYTHERDAFNGSATYRTGYTPLLAYLCDSTSDDTKRAQRLGPLGLAIWYQDMGRPGDDFVLTTSKFSESQCKRLAMMLWLNFGLSVEVLNTLDDRGTKYLIGDAETKKKFGEICGDYIHPTMALKCGTSDKLPEPSWSAHLERTLVSSKVLSITPSTEPSLVYDFTVADNNNFFSNGILSKNCIDEVDVIRDTKAYAEAQNIPAPINGQYPITVLTSTRKFAYGLVQREIDEAKETGLKYRHWNLIDVTTRCLPERHKPELPRMTLYRSDSLLKHVKPEKYEELGFDQKALYTKVEDNFAGCGDCKIYAMCKGRLATHQTSTSPFLKPIEHTMNQFRKNSVAMAKAQLLCLKPSSEGLIYPTFDQEVHMITAADMAMQLTGEEFHPDMSKAELIRVLKSMEIRWFSGMDFGYTHNFAVVTAACDGYRAFIVDVIAIPELDPSQQVQVCKDRLGDINPTIFADPENPMMVRTLKKNGFRMREWRKGAGSVIGGIDIVRMMLRPAVGEPRLFLLKGDPGCELLAKRMGAYHFKTDPDGKIGKHPDDENDDECFTGDTEVLTDSGWIRLDEVTMENRVLAIDSAGRSHLEYPKKVISKEYVGPVHFINHHHLEFTATEGHLHGVMRQMDWKVRGEYRLEKRPVNGFTSEMYWPQGPLIWPSGTGLFADGPDEAWMAGFWLAEGCFDTNRPTFLLVDQSKVRWQQEVRARLTKLDWHWTETVTPPENDNALTPIRFVMSGQGSRRQRWLDMFGQLSHKKSLKVEHILQMTDEERREFWEGYMAGDGCRTQSGWHFDSVSQDLVEGMQVLSMALGYGCRIVSYDCMREGRVVNTPNGTYVGRQNFRGHVLRKKPVVHISKARIGTKMFSGKVYCVETSTGFFQARTNGKPFVAGNCDATRYLIMNVFSSKGPIRTEGNEEKNEVAIQDERRATFNLLMQDAGVTEDEEEPENSRGKKGGFIWDMS